MDYLERTTGVKRLSSSLLDSSVITKYNTQKYTIKLIRMGEYNHLYYCNKVKIKKNQELENIKDSNLKIDNLLLKKDNIKKTTELKEIDIRNINRSKTNFKRLVLANEEKFKTFITLTFSENIKDLKYANKLFNYWCANIRHKKKDFLYICVPEFQKRGAVHYHLLTNLDIKENPDIIIPQLNFTVQQYLKMSEEQRKKCYDVKYWPHGFSNVKSLYKIKPVVYMSKYMTKNIDNRLFGHRRYFYSNNLTKPEVVYLDLDNDVHFNELADILANSQETYSNSYLDLFGDVIDFVELKKGKSEDFPHGDLLHTS